MAYSPVEHSPNEQKGMLDHPQLLSIAARHRATPAQVALAWLLRQEIVIIPKAGTPAHIRENRAALDLTLTDEDLANIDRAFPRPRKKLPLAVK